MLRVCRHRFARWNCATRDPLALTLTLTCCASKVGMECRMNDLGLPVSGEKLRSSGFFGFLQGGRDSREKGELWQASAPRRQRDAQSLQDLVHYILTLALKTRGALGKSSTSVP